MDNNFQNDSYSMEDVHEEVINQTEVCTCTVVSRVTMFSIDHPSKS